MYSNKRTIIGLSLLSSKMLNSSVHFTISKALDMSIEAPNTGFPFLVKYSTTVDTIHVQEAVPVLTCKRIVKHHCKRWKNGAFFALWGYFGIGVWFKKILGPTNIDYQFWFWIYSPNFLFFNRLFLGPFFSLLVPLE